VFLSSSTNRSVSYAGLTIQFVRVACPLAGRSSLRRLHASSLSRALLENLSRDSRTSTERTVPIDELERRVEDLLQTGGVEELNRVRDRAREIAAEFGGAVRPGMPRAPADPVW